MFIQRIISIGLLVLGFAPKAMATIDEDAKTQMTGMSTFLVGVVTGPLAKIIAMILLIVGIWKIIHKDYGTAAGCVVAFLVLVFLPKILGIF